jgi:Zn-dependent M28 family amino/carboxypeptidase
MDAWVEKHYHQPSDEYRDDWDLAGAIEDNQLLFYAGYEIANQEAMPKWQPGDEFEAARLKKP